LRRYRANQVRKNAITTENKEGRGELTLCASVFSVVEGLYDFRPLCLILSTLGLAAEHEVVAMGVGHAAVALAASRAAPRVNVGWLIFAAFLADFLLGVFALLGLEQASVPPEFAKRHYLLFDFPYSHGLVPLLLWGAIAGFVLSRLRRNDATRAFLVVWALVVSHFVLDGLVHIAGLPILGDRSPKLGLGLWNHLPLELALETLMTVAGVVVYWKAAGRNAAWSRWGIAIFMTVLAALTWTQLFSSAPPDPSKLPPFWILAPVIFAGLALAIDRTRAARAGTAPAY